MMSLESCKNQDDKWSNDRECFSSNFVNLTAEDKKTISIVALKTIITNNYQYCKQCKDYYAGDIAKACDDFLKKLKRY